MKEFIYMCCIDLGAICTMYMVLSIAYLEIYQRIQSKLCSISSDVCTNFPIKDCLFLHVLKHHLFFLFYRDYVSVHSTAPCCPCIIVTAWLKFARLYIHSRPRTKAHGSAGLNCRVYMITCLK